MQPSPSGPTLVLPPPSQEPREAGEGHSRCDHTGRYTRHCTLQTAHCTLHTEHCTLHAAHCTMTNAHYTPHTAHFTLNTAHCTLHTAHCTLHTARVGKSKPNFYSDFPQKNSSIPIVLFLFSYLRTWKFKWTWKMSSWARLLGKIEPSRLLITLIIPLTFLLFWTSKKSETQYYLGPIAYSNIHCNCHAVAHTAGPLFEVKNQKWKY